MEVIGENYKIPISIVRGGTSKGIIIKQEDLFSESIYDKDKMILSIFGSPDKRQIDGLGGADPLTSKLAIVSRSELNGIDIDYTFAQVGIENASIDYSLSCGNLVSGVSIFAIDTGMVKATEPITKVVIFNTNTKKKIIAFVKVKDDKPLFQGNYSIDGVPGMGSKIELEFLRPEGAITGELLPFKNPKSLLKEQNNMISISLIDSGVLACFTNSSDLGLTGDEGPKEIDSNLHLVNRIKEIKKNILSSLSITKDEEDFSRKIANLPKFIFVAKPMDYRSPINGKLIKASEVDLLARVVTSDRLHKAFPITSGIATATAACIPGTIPNEIINKSLEKENVIRIGHPSGIMEVIITIEKYNDSWTIEKAIIGRTARIILDGFVYVPISKVE